MCKQNYLAAFLASLNAIAIYDKSKACYNDLMKNCKTCNQSFIISKDRNIFCSHSCQAKWAITLANKSKKPKKKMGSLLFCIVCNTEYYIPQYRMKSGKSKYCSRQCLAKNHLKNFISVYGFKKLNKPLHSYKVITVDGKRIREHRYIMEQYLGRKLEKWEHVHHINDDSSDNRIENLEILSNSDHQRKEYLFRKKLTSF